VSATDESNKLPVQLVWDQDLDVAISLDHVTNNAGAHASPVHRLSLLTQRSKILAINSSGSRELGIATRYARIRRYVGYGIITLM
jgi:hypothetical protein